MPPFRTRRERSGWTVIELAIALGLIGILATIALPNIDFQRFRMDSQTRVIQNQIMGAQIRAVQINAPVLLTFFFTQSQFRIAEDSNGNGLWQSYEKRNWRSLAERMKFVIPPSTIDGATPYYATGPGLSYVNASGALGTCTSCPTLTLKPDGSSSGEVVVYVGSGQSARKEDFRALQVSGATSKVRIWRMMSDGVWKESNQ